MSGKRQSDSNDNHSRKDKQIKYSDDKPQETGDNIPIFSSLVSSPMELSAEDLSVIYMFVERFGEGSIGEFIKQQEEAISVQQALHQVHQSETGQSSQREILPDPKGKAKIYETKGDSYSDEEYESKQLSFELDVGPRPLSGKGHPRPLFKMLAPRSNRLTIPYELAIEHFRVQPSANQQQADHLEEYTIHLTDCLNFTWEMRFVCFAEEEAFVIVRGWDQYVERHDLMPKDTIQFFMQSSTSCTNSFIIHHKQQDPPSPGYFAPPLFMQENLMCELHLSHMDVVYRRLEMSGFEIPFRHQTQEMVKFTDEKDKSWYMIIEKSRVTNVYTIIDGWEGFVREYKLEAQDMVRVYWPIMPEHGMHFLIQCVKKEKIEKEDGGSDPGQPSDAAGPSQGGASRKGKEIVEG